MEQREPARLCRLARPRACLHDWPSHDETQLLLKLGAKVQIIMEFCVILPQKLNQRKKNLMNRTVIFILIWLLCMPCMAVAETSKELEEAIDKCKQECSALFDSKDTLAYGEKVHELMDLCLKADNEELYYKSWANLATFTSRHNPLKGLKVAEEIRNYAKEHDSKFGIVTALYAQANMSLKANMEERAVELCKEAIDYKNRYLPDVNCTHIYWMLAKIHLVNKRRKEALDALNKCQQEPNLTPYQQMNICAYNCEAACCEEPVDTPLFMSNYTQLQKLKMETGKTSEFFAAQDIYYADVTGQYDRMLQLARQQSSLLTRYEHIFKAYKKMGRWEEALDTLLLYYSVRDSIRTGEIKAEQERIQSELRIARDIQMSMVPDVFPKLEGLDMSAYMNPAKEVGGDLYGYLLQGDKLYFAVGDVSGKGVPASLFMAQATRLFQTMAKQGMMPAEICTRMNDALSGSDNENGMFVTFWLGLVDLQTGHLDYCNAGHNSPVIGGGENHGDFLEMIPNAPIGLWSELEYEGEEIDSIKNRPLFIYTDGLNEAENPQQEQFGDDRLLDALRQTQFENPQQVIESLKQEVEVFRNGAEPNDDLTMMCLYVS